MSARCVIISGGEFCSIGELCPDDYIIACDRGYEYASECGIVPDLVVGDFDSYSGDVAKDIPIDRYISEKDDTDTMIAIRYAVEQGFTDIAMFCALGGRMDHMLANVQAAMFAAQHGVNVWLHDEHTDIYTLNHRSMSFSKREGYSISVFALTDLCRGVTLSGTKYPLKDATISNSFPIGVSNEWKAEIAEVNVKEGILLVILSQL